MKLFRLFSVLLLGFAIGTTVTSTVGQADVGLSDRQYALCQEWVAAYATKTPTVTQTLTPTHTPIPTDTPTLSPTATVVSTLYVSTSGSDSNVGSESKPFRTIRKAISMVKPGDVVYVRAGTYNEAVEIANKTDFILSAYPNEAAVIDGVNKYSAGVELRNATRVTVNGFVIKRAGYEGVLLSGSNYNTISRNQILNSGGVGLHLTSQYGETSHNIIKDNEVSMSKEEGIYLDVKTANINPVDFNLVQGNYVHGSGYENLQNTNQNGVNPRPNYNSFIGNRLEFNGNDWSAVDLSGVGLVFDNNVVINNKARLGGVWIAESNVVSVNNNTITNLYKSLSYGDAIVLSNTVGSTIRNNVITCKIGMCVSGINQINTNTAIIIDGNQVTWQQ